MSIIRLVSLYVLCLSTIASATPIPLVHNTTNVPTHELTARGNGEHHGVATYYDPNDNFGACQTLIQNGDYAVALSTDEWQAGALCGKSITVSNSANGRSVSGVIVRDLCPGCELRDGNKNNIDLTSGVFSQLADLSVGVIDVVWEFDD